jgi:hypothetical protein
MSEPQIIDDCLSPAFFKLFQERCMDWNSRGFFLLDSTAHPKDIKSNVIDPLDYSFYHLIMQDGERFSDLAELAEAAVRMAIEKSGRTCAYIQRVRIGLITGQTENYTHGSHVDLEYPHSTGLLYLNTCDGDTVIYDQLKDKETPSQAYIGIELEELTRIKPKANRVAFIDGLQFHSSSTPTNSHYRMVLNFNFLEDHHVKTDKD